MNYQFLLTYDLSGAETKDYEDLKVNLERIGFLPYAVAKKEKVKLTDTTLICLSKEFPDGMEAGEIGDLVMKEIEGAIDDMNIKVEFVLVFAEKLSLSIFGSLDA